MCGEGVGQVVAGWDGSKSTGVGTNHFTRVSFLQCALRGCNDEGGCSYHWFFCWVHRLLL